MDKEGSVEILTSWNRRTNALMRFDIEPVTDNGTTTDVFRLKERGQQPLYLRILPKWAKSAETEVMILNRLHGLGVKSPRIIYAEDCVPEFGGRSCVIESGVPGVAIGDNSKASRHILRDAAYDLARIHTVNVSGFGNLSVQEKQLMGKYTTYEAYFFAEIMSKLAFIGSMDLLPSHLVTRLEWLIGHLFKYLDKDSAVLIHGDYGGRHIFRQNNHYTGMIDFGDAMGGSRYTDLGKLYVTDRAIAPEVVRCYSEVYKFPDDVMHKIELESLFYIVQKVFYKSEKGSKIPNGYLSYIAAFNFLKNPLNKVDKEI